MFRFVLCFLLKPQNCFPHTADVCSDEAPRKSVLGPGRAKPRPARTAFTSAPPGLGTRPSVVQAGCNPTGATMRHAADTLRVRRIMHSSGSSFQREPNSQHDTPLRNVKDRNKFQIKVKQLLRLLRVSVCGPAN